MEFELVSHSKPLPNASTKYLIKISIYLHVTFIPLFKIYIRLKYMYIYAQHTNICSSLKDVCLYSKYLNIYSKYIYLHTHFAYICLKYAYIYSKRNGFYSKPRNIYSNLDRFFQRRLLRGVRVCKFVSLNLLELSNEFNLHYFLPTCGLVPHLDHA